MPRTAEIYDILLSCPGDVCDLKEIVKDCIDEFNRSHGEYNNIKLELKHWSTHSYPESGGSAQQLLNSQFINDCDACIAMFGCRFGSPTDEYESGTEQEIEEMIATGKQVFMYFIERDIDPSKIDFEQYTKVRKFKEKYIDEKKGIYCVIKSAEDFRRELSNHLALHFIRIVTEKTGITIEKKTPELKIDYSYLKNYKENRAFSSSEFINLKKKSINEKIEEIKSIDIPIKNKKETDEKVRGNNPVMRSLIGSNINLENINSMLGQKFHEVSILDVEKTTISEYCNKERITINDDFWNIGDLRKVVSTNIMASQLEYKYSGDKKSEKKYSLIQEVYDEIDIYNGYIKYFKKIEEYNYLMCYISNVGTMFDEDIDIKIKIPKEYFVNYTEIPMPEVECLDEINEMEILKIIFSAHKNPDIEQYSGYISKVDWYSNPINGIYKESYSGEKSKYNNTLEEIFCYDQFEDDLNYILKFNIKYLKQKNSMFFPSVIILKDIPEYIEYEINSKHNADIIRGKINF